MMMTPSTASSLRRSNATETSPWVGCGTGMSVIEYPASVAAPAIASSVRMLPKLERVNMITPMLWNRPLRSALAALFGR